MSLTTKERVEREKQRRNAANTRMREKVAAANPHFPASGPTQWLFQGPPAESKFLAAGFSRLIEPLTQAIDAKRSQ